MRHADTPNVKRRPHVKRRPLFAVRESGYLAALIAGLWHA